MNELSCCQHGMCDCQSMEGHSTNIGVHLRNLYVATATDANELGIKTVCLMY